MNTDLGPVSPKFAVTTLGLDVMQPLTLSEWSDFGTRLGSALRSFAFMVGDWLVYGEGRDGQLTLWPDAPENDRVEEHLYERAGQLTGLDIATLVTYAYVARSVPRSLRNEHVSWEHHRKVAKLQNDDEKREWLTLAAETQLAGQPISLRLFARSINAGRLMTREELDSSDADAGIENVHPHVNRIVAFFGRLKDTGWLATADADKRAALKRDLEPILVIHSQL